MTNKKIQRPNALHISATEFKSNCLELMDRVKRSRCEIIITKRNKPVARLVPVEGEELPSLFGALRHRGLRILGDLTEPTGEVWNAEEGRL